LRQPNGEGRRGEYYRKRSQATPFPHQQYRLSDGGVCRQLVYHRYCHCYHETERSRPNRGHCVSVWVIAQRQAGHEPRYEPPSWAAPRARQPRATQPFCLSPEGTGGTATKANDVFFGSTRGETRRTAELRGLNADETPADVCCKQHADGTGGAEVGPNYAVPREDSDPPRNIIDARRLALELRCCSACNSMNNISCSLRSSAN